MVHPLENAVEVTGRGSSSTGHRWDKNQKVQDLLSSLSLGNTGHLLIKGCDIATKKFKAMGFPTSYKMSGHKSQDLLQLAFFGENELHFRSIFPQGFEEGGQMVG